MSLAFALQVKRDRAERGNYVTVSLTFTLQVKRDRAERGTM